MCMSTEVVVNVFCVVSVVSGSEGLLFSCITKQSEVDSFKCSRSNGEYCVASLVVVS